MRIIVQKRFGNCSNSLRMFKIFYRKTFNFWFHEVLEDEGVDSIEIKGKTMRIWLRPLGFEKGWQHFKKIDENTAFIEYRAKGWRQDI
jgi:hypothetical protein